MTNTERAIAKLYYRLVYVQHIMTFEQVPAAYQPWLEEYLRELDA